MDNTLKGELDGIGTTFFIKQKFDLPDIYITSYYADKFIIKRAQVTHPSGFLLKPFNESYLVE